VIQGNNFKVEFDESTGTIYSLTYDSTTIIAAGNGPKLDVLRAFTNNDNWFYSSWFDRGLHHLQHKAKETTIMNKPDGSIVLAFTVESQAPHAAKILGGTSSGKNTIEELTGILMLFNELSAFPVCIIVDRTTSVVGKIGIFLRDFHGITQKYWVVPVPVRIRSKN